MIAAVDNIVNDDHEEDAVVVPRHHYRNPNLQIYIPQNIIQEYLEFVVLMDITPHVITHIVLITVFLPESITSRDQIIRQHSLQPPHHR